MPVPGLGPFPLPVPIVHSDHPPEGWEAEVFTYKEASEWDEHWAGIDLEQARFAANVMIDAFRLTRDLPLLP